MSVERHSLMLLQVGVKLNALTEQGVRELLGADSIPG